MTPQVTQPPHPTSVSRTWWLGLPTVTEGDGDRCRCGRGVRGRLV